ncbi:Fis family transcriptional regulator [Burkholderia sp. AU33423]|nr:Fis family transcriptional regulator [Burkholderia sp. AU33423]
MDATDRQPCNELESARITIFHNERSEKICVEGIPESVRLALVRLAPSKLPILIGGETGTGKEVVARFIHDASNLPGPFVGVNCGAISEQLADSELFGHEAGSFTGATSRRQGWFEVANNGTLFLDEVGDLAAPLQVKLLRVLQEGELFRVGSRSPIKVNLRIIAATNVNLDDAVVAGVFRQDLFFRLNAGQIYLPPLRTRPGDIPLLANHILRSATLATGKQYATLTVAALSKLCAYSWPGNIRELANVLHRGLIESDGGAILPEHLHIRPGLGDSPERSSAAAPQSPPRPAGTPSGLESLDVIRAELERLLAASPTNLLNSVEALLVKTALRASGANQVRAAQLLGITRSVMRTLLTRHRLIDDRQK